MTRKYEWQTSGIEFPQNYLEIVEYFKKNPTIFLLVGIDTVGKTELSKFMEYFYEFARVNARKHLRETENPFSRKVDFYQNQGNHMVLFLAYMGTFFQSLDSHRNLMKSIVFDPFDPIQGLARSRDFDEYLQKNMKNSLEMILNERSIVLIHGTARPEVTFKRLVGRILDPEKGSLHDKELHDNHEKCIQEIESIKTQVGFLREQFSENPRFHSFDVDTSEAPGYPTNFSPSQFHDILNTAYQGLSEKQRTLVS